MSAEIVAHVLIKRNKDRVQQGCAALERMNADDPAFETEVRLTIRRVGQVDRDLCFCVVWDKLSDLARKSDQDDVLRLAVDTLPAHFKFERE